MPERKTVKRARKAKREGKASTTQAGEFVREEMEHVRKGKHGARSTKQAVAIGLSKARRSGVKLKLPEARSGVRAHTQERSAGVPCWSERAAKEAIGAAIACDVPRAQTRTAARGLPQGTVQAGPIGSDPASSSGRGVSSHARHRVTVSPHLIELEFAAEITPIRRGTKSWAAALVASGRTTERRARASTWRLYLR